MASGMIDAPVMHAAAITADVTLSYKTTGVYVGTGGDLQVIMAAGNTITFSNVPSGVILPIRITEVVSTSTTASDLIALWN